MDVLIAGAGSIGRKEVSELQAHPDVHVTGVVDVNAIRRAAVSSVVPEAYDDIADALAETDPDLVRIATPPQTHYEISMTALEAGSDVYVEKIMTLDSDQAREIVETASRLERSVYVRRNAIYTPVYRRAWDKLDDLGELRYVHWIEPVGEYSEWEYSKRKWLRDLPGEIISEHLPHPLYVIRWFLQEEPTVEDVLYDGTELHVSLTAGQKSARISYVAPTDIPMIFDVVGSQGTIRIDHSAMRIHEPRGFEDSSTVVGRTARANLHDLFGSVKNLLRLSQQYARRELQLNPHPLYSQSDNYRQFTDIVNGGEPEGEFRIDGEEGVRNVELFEEIWDRAETSDGSGSYEPSSLR